MSLGATPRQLLLCCSFLSFLVTLSFKNVTLKARQARLHWYGNILRMDQENKVKQTMKMEVRGTRAKVRPRMRWMNYIRHDMDKCGLEEGDA